MNPERSLTEARWSRSQLIAFRFVVSYFVITTLYLAVAHVGNLLPFAASLADSIAYRRLLAAFRWGIEQLFGDTAARSVNTTAGFLAYHATALLGAGVATVVWSLLDRGRASYERAHAVLRIYLRYLLAAVAISYGVVKVIPSQFAPPSLVALITPLGEFTRMRVLWHSMGTSTAYVIFTGLVEVLGGLLLLSRRTTPFGALILTAAFINVTVLNFGYEVGVQVNTVVYTLMALTLLAPEARRLARVFFDNIESRSVVSSTRRRLGTVAKGAFVVLLLTMQLRYALRSREAVMQRPALYGIYDVTTFTRDGVTLPPTDEGRWQRLVLAERGSGAIQWSVGGRIDSYSVLEDSANHTFTLTGRGRDAKPLTLRYKRETDSLLIVGGRVDDREIEARLSPVDVSRFPLRRPRR